MSFSKWITKKAITVFGDHLLSPIVSFLRGKKTYLGLAQLVLAFAIMAGHAFPEASPISDYARILAELLSENGLDFAEVLSISGAGWTVIGVLDKIGALLGWTKKEPLPF